MRGSVSDTMARFNRADPAGAGISATKFPGYAPVRRQMTIYFRSMANSGHGTENGREERRSPRRCSSLQLHHAECEVNFRRLEKLLCGFDADCEIEVGIPLPNGRADVLSLRVIERSPYTAVVQMSQRAPVWGGRSAQMQVRVYLDARMAEVIAYQNVRYFRARYDYPNPRMFARDEKWQLNRLLGEWLSVCLAEGHALRDVAIAVGN